MTGGCNKDNDETGYKNKNMHAGMGSIKQSNKLEMTPE